MYPAELVVFANAGERGPSQGWAVDHTKSVDTQTAVFCFPSPRIINPPTGSRNSGDQQTDHWLYLETQIK